MKFNVKLYLKGIERPFEFNNVVIGFDPSIFRVFVDRVYGRIHKKSINFPLSNILYCETEMIDFDERDKLIEDEMAKTDVRVKNGKLVNEDQSNPSPFR